MSFELINETVDTRAQAKVVRNIYQFLCAAQGNWRNSLYINCDDCKKEKTSVCGNFLAVPGSDGFPHLIPTSLIHSMTGSAPEPEECLGKLSMSRFCCLYSSCLQINTNGKSCPLLELMGAS